MKNFNFTSASKLATLAALIFVNVVSAKTFTVVTAGKWSDAKIWENDNPGNEVAAGDIVIIKNHITMNADIAVSGTIIVEKGYSVISNRTLHITTSGKLVNNGNFACKRLMNEGTIENNSMMESMNEMENRGSINNHANVVAGTNLLNYGGTVTGNKGTYFANSSVISSAGATFGHHIKIYHNGEQNTASVTSMTLEADVINHNVLLSVNNPKMETATFFTIERSFDGKNYQVISEMTASNNTMIYQDKNIDSDTVHYKVKVNGLTYLPEATVSMPASSTASIR